MAFIIGVFDVEQVYEDDYKDDADGENILEFEEN